MAELFEIKEGSVLPGDKMASGMLGKHLEMGLNDLRMPAERKEEIARTTE